MLPKEAKLPVVLIEVLLTAGDTMGLGKDTIERKDIVGLGKGIEPGIRMIIF